MKKFLSIILLTVMLLTVFTSCAATSDDEIRYPLLNSDTKIESLSSDMQEKIDAYVTDCKALYTASYARNLKRFNGEPYISFTDTFVYDFSKVDEDSLSEMTSKLWNDIKALNEESTPIMYIELQGFVNYFGDSYKPTALVEGAIIYGYFIFENETVEPTLYRYIVNKYYCYEMIEGTELINCGDKYSEEKKMDVIVDLYEAIQEESEQLPDDLLKRLTLLDCGGDGV